MTNQDVLNSWLSFWTEFSEIELQEDTDIKVTLPFGPDGQDFTFTIQWVKPDFYRLVDENTLSRLTSEYNINLEEQIIYHILRSRGFLEIDGTNIVTYSSGKYLGLTMFNLGLAVVELHGLRFRDLRRDLIEPYHRGGKRFRTLGIK